MEGAPVSPVFEPLLTLAFSVMRVFLDDIPLRTSCLLFSPERACTVTVGRHELLVVGNSVLLYPKVRSHDYSWHCQ